MKERFLKLIDSMHKHIEDMIYKVSLSEKELIEIEGKLLELTL